MKILLLVLLLTSCSSNKLLPEILKEVSEMKGVISNNTGRIEEEVYSAKKGINQSKEKFKFLNSRVDRLEKKLQKVEKEHYHFLVKEAYHHYSKKEYKLAKALYLKAAEYDKIKYMSAVLYRLGLINYYTGNKNDSAFYFAQLILKFNKSTFVPSSLYHLGLLFLRKRDLSNAKKSFEEIIETYKYNKYYLKKAKHMLRKI